MSGASNGDKDALRLKSSAAHSGCVVALQRAYAAHSGHAPTPASPSNSPTPAVTPKPTPVPGAPPTPPPTPAPTPTPVPGSTLSPEAIDVLCAQALGSCSQCHASHPECIWCTVSGGGACLRQNSTYGQLCPAIGVPFRQGQACPAPNPCTAPSVHGLPRCRPVDDVRLLQGVWLRHLRWRRLRHAHGSGLHAGQRHVSLGVDRCHQLPHVALVHDWHTSAHDHEHDADHDDDHDERHYHDVHRDKNATFTFLNAASIDYDCGGRVKVHCHSHIHAGSDAAPSTAALAKSSIRFSRSPPVQTRWLLALFLEKIELNGC